MNSLPAGLCSTINERGWNIKIIHASVVQVLCKCSNSLAPTPVEVSGINLFSSAVAAAALRPDAFDRARLGDGVRGRGQTGGRKSRASPPAGTCHAFGGRVEGLF